MSAVKNRKQAGGKRIYMRQLPKPGEIYKHFKGNCYRVITVATHTETGEKLVIYQALYGDYGVYARELFAFTGPVDKEKYPYVTQKKRFELVESGAIDPAALKSAGPGEPAAMSEPAGMTKQSAGQGSDAEESIFSGISGNKQSPEHEAEPQIDPMVLAYLDADTCKEKLQILTTMKDRLTDQMINTMAIAIDVEVKPGDITERYEELKYCLAMRERFECRRLR